MARSIAGGLYRSSFVDVFARREPIHGGRRHYHYMLGLGVVNQLHGIILGHLSGIRYYCQLAQGRRLVVVAVSQLAGYVSSHESVAMRDVRIP